VVKTINANCLDVLKETAANSQDLIFCDPPYALGSDVIIRKDGKPDYRKAVDFMSKWQQPDGYFWEQWFSEAFRVLRYGGRVVMFGMDRQLMLNKYYACFAGFAEQQSLYWYFISNFPKASDLGKMLDKNAGAEREVVGKHQNPAGSKGNTFPLGQDVDLTAPATTLAQKYNGMKYSIAPLKQTNETILVFQKPYKTGSCLHDTLAYENGDDTCMCGAVDVEGNRCEIDEDEPNKRTNAKNHKRTIDNGVTGYGQGDMKIKNGGHACLHDLGFHNSNGRYPAQTYLDDEAAKVLDGQSGISKSDSVNGVTDCKLGTTSTLRRNDTGGCSRILHRCNYDLNDYDIYHYCPKVSNKERNEGCGDLEKKAKTEKYVGGETKCSVCGKFFLSTKSLCECSEMEFGAKSTRILNPTTNNHHPTVKPIALLKKIIQLFKTPNPLHVLDPFMGSGSMGIACIELGVSYTGVELDAEYYTIAQTRLAHHDTKNKSKLF
jgi:DNA modification methylase